MQSSDSEGFESADEGHTGVEKKERKKRLSSSNYSDDGPEADVGLKNASKVVAEEKVKDIKEQSDGWDDFDFNEGEDIKPWSESVPKEVPDPKDTGWDAFDDWEAPKPQAETDTDVKEVTERLAATSTTSPTSSGWGWGAWGVDSLLSTTTAGLSTLTNQVSQGITSVLETGIGAPDPEELARQTAAGSASAKTPDDDKEQKPEPASEVKSEGDGGFSFGSILKFVGNTGTNIIAGGLDTLETIGRKAMDVLQEGDPYLAKKRALLGLDPDKPVLSQVLREAKVKADEEDRIREEKREAKEVHYENLFDDFGGLVHLEALEMLSKQINMRIEEQLRNATPSNRSEMKETLQQVIELCEMPEDEDEYCQDDDAVTPADQLHQWLQGATSDLSIQMQFQPLVKHYTEILEWFDQPDIDKSIKNIHKRAIGAMAHATALSVELYHKASEQMAVLTRRSTADEADAITRLTVVLRRHINDIANLFTDRLHKESPVEEFDQAQAYITNIFLEGDNSVSYIHSAFLLTQPILQIGSI